MRVTTATEPLQRVSELWFNDGTVVFQAGDKLYLVYTEILSDCSTVFRDMFSIPQPSTQETFAGVPLIKIPDAASDVTPFFEAVFRAGTLPFEAISGTNKSVVIPILRLSVEYQVKHLLYHALRHINACIPSSWQEYDVVPVASPR
ncbi:hypothetical protein BDV98DRAFT_217190 [Pterulicium gracile]|uniref:BTB domain-containing protein n=1 Tax=Pterulicium gracile TaxID=1884261 RepID=A0A5C3Q7G0_9AGAR|nr:hypothetical protein BDV98DRAFT_217190 [Pterula gracilis]